MAPSYKSRDNEHIPAVVQTLSEQTESTLNLIQKNVEALLSKGKGGKITLGNKTIYFLPDAELETIMNIVVRIMMQTPMEDVCMHTDEMWLRMMRWELFSRLTLSSLSLQEPFLMSPLTSMLYGIRIPETVFVKQVRPKRLRKEQQKHETQKNVWIIEK